jgi:hypothetical protein
LIVLLFASLALIARKGLAPGLVTYPVIHVIAGVYWTSALLVYALIVRGVGELAPALDACR